LGPVHGCGAPAVAAALPVSLLAATQDTVPDELRPLLPAVQLVMINEQPHVDHGPVGSLLLAIRAARRAVDADPNDAVAHLRLGHAYERMQARTVEQSAATEFPLLTEMRRVQAIAALTTALRLRPDLLAAHQLLVGLYERANAIDLALRHLQQQLRL